MYRTSVYGSAVCVYNLTAFDVAFEGPFKYQQDSQSAWTRAPNRAPFKVRLYLAIYWTISLSRNSDYHSSSLSMYDLFLNNATFCIYCPRLPRSSLYCNEFVVVYVCVCVCVCVSEWTVD